MLYKGSFNWAGETYEMFTQAVSLGIAFTNFVAQLSKKIGFSKRSIAQYFNGSKDNYYIEEVK